jgi:hypothetical protein
MATNLDQIKNFGPYMIKLMHRLDIFTLEDLEQYTYAELYAAIEAIGILPHLNIFYSIEMGLQGRAWNDITPSEKLQVQQLIKATHHE